MKWISFKDEKPKNKQLILAYSKEYDAIYSLEVIIETWGAYEFECECGRGWHICELEDISHWMPRPEPPLTDEELDKPLKAMYGSTGFLSAKLDEKQKAKK